MNSERYLPLWPPSLLVYFGWFWVVFVNPLIFFLRGCPYEYIMWARFGKRLQPESGE